VSILHKLIINFIKKKQSSSSVYNNCKHSFLFKQSKTKKNNMGGKRKRPADDIWL